MRKSLQEYGIHDYFYYPRGQYNAITDVSGVKVGQTTIIECEGVRTGVTVVMPPIDFAKDKLVVGGYAFNANGETTGLQYILEEARLISPIFLTNTLSVGDVYNAVVDYYKGTIALPIIGECWDGYLNHIEGRHVKKEHVVAAIESCKSGPVEEGNVGAGTGMTSFGFKGGIGTSSRIIKIDGKDYVLGVLVNNNLGNEQGQHRYLRIGSHNINDTFWRKQPLPPIADQSDSQASSSIVVIATDIPLQHHQLNRISKRAVLGMGRIGVVSYSDSGEFMIAFSTANKVPKRGEKGIYQMNVIEESHLDSIFEATIEAVEEALLNSIFCAEDMVGRDGHKMEALPIDEILKEVKSG
jgi:D-aminopeptidase